MKKSLLIIATIAAILVIAIYFFIQNRSYTLFDITADNYEKRLHPNRQSIFSAGIHDCLPESVDLYNIAGYANNSTTKQTSEGFKIEWKSDNTQLLYTLAFKDKDKLVFLSLLSGPSENYELIKKIIDRLILEKGFLLKKTEYISGRDILIKETDHNFIIVRLYSKYDNLLVGIDIQSYSKKRGF